MKALLLTLLVACIATTSFAQETRKVYTQSHVLEKQGSGQITRDDLRKRLSEIESILKSVEWTPKREPARQMTKEQHDTEVEWNKWLLDIRNRLKAQATDIQVLLKKKLSEEEMVEKMAEGRSLQFDTGLVVHSYLREALLEAYIGESAPRKPGGKTRFRNARRDEVRTARPAS